MQDRLGIIVMSKDKPNKKRRARKKRQALATLPDDEVREARLRGRQLAEEANAGLEQNEDGEMLPEGHSDEDIDEIGQSDQLASKCDEHGHLWDPTTGDCNEEGCTENYHKQNNVGGEYKPGWNDPRKMTPEELTKDYEEHLPEAMRKTYYDNKAKKHAAETPYIFWMFVATIVIVLSYFFWQLFSPS